MRISQDTNYDQLHSHFADSALLQPPEKPASAQVTLVDDFLPRRRSKTDVLADALYHPFHKRMTREEKAMTASDRAKVLADMEYLEALLQLLNQHDWAKHLPKITVINNTRDTAELQLKLRLTRAEIARLLANYDSWKRRCDLLAGDMREYALGVDSDDEDDEVFLLPLLALLAKRERERRHRNGPVVRLCLHNGCEIVRDSYGIPRVVPEGSYILLEAASYGLKNLKTPTENGKMEPGLNRKTGSGRERRQHSSTPANSVRRNRNDTRKRYTGRPS